MKCEAAGQSNGGEVRNSIASRRSWWKFGSHKVWVDRAVLIVCKGKCQMAEPVIHTQLERICSPGHARGFCLGATGALGGTWTSTLI